MENLLTLVRAMEYGIKMLKLMETLQKMLDKVTFLKQEALGTFAAHELNDVRAADCFIGMCHALSDKINAKLSRQHLDKRLGELVSAIGKLSGPTPP